MSWLTSLWVKLTCALNAIRKSPCITVSIPLSSGHKVPMIRLILNRIEFTDKSTIGELSIDGVRICYTLEDTCRDHKIAGVTAIPPGTYSIIITRSAKFQKDLPLLLNVPGYEGIRIHSGNKDQDTEGCILVGLTKDKDWIGDSHKAMDIVMPLIEAGLKDGGKVGIAIIGGREHA